MMRDVPIHTYWSIMGMTLVALAVTHLLGVSDNHSIWVFVGFMLLGIPLGEILERRARRSKPPS